MPSPDIRLTLRLTPELHAQLEARTSRTRTLSDVVRKALRHALTCAVSPVADTMPHAPSDTVDAVLADVVQRLTALEARLTALETPRPPRPTLARTTPTTADSAPLPPTQTLGPLCRQGHAWQGTGQSARKRSSGGCVVCDREQQRARRARQREG